MAAAFRLLLATVLLRAAAARVISTSSSVPIGKLSRSALITVLNNAKVDFDEQAPIKALRKKARSLVGRRPSLKDTDNMDDDKRIPASMSMPIDKLSRSALITVLNNAKVDFDEEAPIKALRKKARSLVGRRPSLKDTDNMDDDKRLPASMSVPVDKLPRAALITVLNNAKEIFDEQAPIDDLRKMVQELVRRGPKEDKVKKNTASSRLLTCACTTTECLATNKTSCTSEYKCYVQYLLKKDNSDPITRGCVRGLTPLLCENRQPMKVSRNKWPYLMCCDHQDLCNEGPVNVTSLSLKQANQSQQRSQPTITAGADMLQQWVSNAGSAASQGFVVHGLSKVIVLTVLFTGLFLLVCIMAYGFHLIRKQRSYIRRMCVRTVSGDSRPLMRAPPQRLRAPPDQQASRSEEQEPSVDLDLPPALAPGVPGPSGVSKPRGKAAVPPSRGSDNRQPPRRLAEACLLRGQRDASPPCGQASDSLPSGQGGALSKRGKANTRLSGRKGGPRPSCSRKLPIKQFPETMILE